MTETVTNISLKHNTRRNQCLLSVTFLLLVVCFGCRDSIITPPSEHIPEMRGFSYTSFAATGFAQGGQRDAVSELKTQINNTWIALIVFEFQSSPTSSDIAPNTTGINPLLGSVWSTSSTENDIRNGAQQARLKNMNIMLKPQIDLYNGEWRAAIHPDDSGSWFNAYTATMMKYAQLAAELNIELLCIGTEFVFATQPKYTPRWRALIDTLRTVYSGKLTYAANWSGLFTHGITIPEYEQVQFWNVLDYIGIDAYYPLTNLPNDSIPTRSIALNRMAGPVNSIRNVSAGVNKPVIVTETGIQSVRGALAAPWDYTIGSSSNAIQDNRVQEFYYSVMIDAIGKQSWCAGIFWWNWESVPSSYERTNYTPRDKPAAQTIKLWYSLIPA